MLEPPDISRDELTERLVVAYGLVADDVEFLPIGNDSRAWVYRVTVGDGTRFLKVRSGMVDRSTLVVPRFLADSGIEHLVAPIPTFPGALSDVGDRFTFILYPFVSGRNGGEAGLSNGQWTELGAVLRRIHETRPTGSVRNVVRHERFLPAQAGLVRTIWASIDRGAVADRFQRALSDVWRSRREEIGRIVARAEELGSRARERGLEQVICHGDIHPWNVLVAPSGGFVIVDWDETGLAPRERDLMFVHGGVGGLEPDAASFYAGYGEVDVDTVTLAYYRYDWVVQELADYAKRVFLTPDAGERTRAEAVASAALLFDPGEVVEAAYRSEDAIERRGERTTRTRT
jgi:spectinomycin phosphotransferase